MNVSLKKAIILSVMALVFCTAKAQDKSAVSIETYEKLTAELKKCNTFVVDFDTSNMTYGDLTHDEFITYCKGTYGYDPDYIDILFKKWKGEFYKDPKFMRPEDAATPFRIHVTLADINELAGMKATAVVTYKDSIDYSFIDLSVGNGRWNTFGKLLLEKAEEQVSKLKAALNSKKPYLFCKDKASEEAIKQEIKNNKSERKIEKEKQKWAEYYKSFRKQQ